MAGLIKIFFWKNKTIQKSAVKTGVNCPSTYFHSNFWGSLKKKNMTPLHGSLDGPKPSFGASQTSSLSLVQDLYKLLCAEGTDDLSANELCTGVAELKGNVR